MNKWPTANVPMYDENGVMTMPWQQWFMRMGEKVENIVNDNYPATAVATITGTYVSGALSDILNPYANYYKVDEVTGVPGWEIRVTFGDVKSFTKLKLLMRYNGANTHFIDIRLWKVTTSTWHTIFRISDTLNIRESYEISDIDPTDYTDDGGVVIVSIYHTTTGNAAHDFLLYYCGLFDERHGESYF